MVTEHPQLDAVMRRVLDAAHTAFSALLITAGILWLPFFTAITIYAIVAGPRK